MSALDDLIPELAGKPLAFTPGGLVLVRLPKGCLAIFTRADYLAAVQRGRRVLRSRAYHQRLQSVRISDTAQAGEVGVDHEA